MIRATIAGLASVWIARDVERGNIPEKFAVPLTFLVARMPAPLLVMGAIGYGLYRLNIETRVQSAKNVTPPRRANTSPRKSTSTRSRSKKRPSAKVTERPA